MSERDDFWDIGKLMPKRSAARLSPFATERQTVDYSAPAVSSEPSRADSERKLSDSVVRGVRESAEHVYCPDDAGLIKRVVVKKYVDKYDFYDSFRKSALLYFDYNAPRCEFAQFYSYMPQYAHLTPSQKSYYFWWRSQLREGKYIKSDYSYLYLYVYEILNLPDKIPPKDGIRMLCRVWREYRAALPRIDMYFAIWVADYCLVHGVKCPTEEISDFLFDCISAAPLKEFFLSDINVAGLSGTETLLAYLSDYDWRRGKHASDSLASSVLKDGSYRGHMIRAMYLLLSEIWNNTILGEGATRATIVRDAFPNTLCTHSVKCRLEVEYISFAESRELRAAVTAAVRYTENKLRALLGVRARLAVKDLHPEYAAVIDRYFAGFVAEEKKRQEIASRPAYEQLYEAPAVSLSLDGAKEIERLSWENAKLLVVEEDEIEYASGMSVDYPNINEDVEAAALDVADAAPDSSIDTHGLGEEEIAYIKLLLGESVSFDPTTPKDSLAERINEAFVDIIGDILLEQVGDEYEIIEDYREEAASFICSLP